ncbi:MAG: hypothetical protein MZV70_02705 [Desulfobacterales bacterium]|nr:hypothetical protein [Desulfobacterales bacterium]
MARKYLADGLKIIKASEAIPQFFFCSTDMVGGDQKRRSPASSRLSATRPFCPPSTRTSSVLPQRKTGTSMWCGS